MKSELTSGEVTFVLILDFRAMNSIVTKPFPRQIGSYKIPILPTNTAISVTVDVGKTGVLASKSIIYVEEDVEFTLPENTDGFFLIATEEPDVLVTEDFIPLRSEQGGGKVYPILLTTELENGDLEYSTLYIFQE
jgi:hypothetical protein